MFLYKKCFLSLFFFSLFCNTHAQFGPKQDIAIDADGVRAIEAVDLNGDGYKDVIAALKFGSRIVWYENMNGLGQFGDEQLISILQETIHLNSNDIDGDGDVDVVGVSPPDDLVVWYENLNAQGDFGLGIEVVNNPLDVAYETKSADIDGDGDIDILASSDSFGDIFWFENLDGLGTFSARKTVGLFGNNGRHFAIADMDNDGDMDVVASSSNTETLSWYRNLDGLGTFGEFIEILPSGSATSDVFITDLDGDMDNDILIATLGQNEVSWIENLDGLGNFGSKNSITTNAMFVLSVYGADLDNDGDIDVISGSPQDNKVAWYENLDGQGTFGQQQILTNLAIGAITVFSADLDNDGDMDILSGSQNDDTIAWFENLTILGTTEQDKEIIRIYPNPAKTVLHIDTTQIIDVVRVYDIHGKEVFYVAKNTQKIVIEGLVSGVYFIALESQDGRLVRKFLKE